MVFLRICISILDRPASGSAKRKVDGLGRDRQRGDADTDGVLNRVGDRWRHSERAGFTDTLGPERAVVLMRVDDLVYYHGRQVEETRDLVISKRRVGNLAGLELHLLGGGETELHDRRARQLGFDNSWIDAASDVGDVDHFENADVTGLGVDL